MLMTRWIFVALGSVVIAACGTRGSAQCAPGARDVARQFFDLDFDGYRLSSDGHEAIWKLTENNGEPPHGEVVVTKEYRVVSETRRPDGYCDVGVDFVVDG